MTHKCMSCKKQDTCYGFKAARHILEIAHNNILRQLPPGASLWTSARVMECLSHEPGSGRVVNIELEFKPEGGNEND